MAAYGDDVIDPRIDQLQALTQAAHQGIQSLGFIMAVGTATCMIAALTFLPALLTVLVRHGWTIKKL